MPKLAIHAAAAITPLEQVREATVILDGPTIEAVTGGWSLPEGARTVDARDQICVPGFIDLHVHGAGGRDLMEATPEAFERVSRTLARFGATSFFPTTVTASVPATLQALEKLAAWIAGGQFPDGAAQPLGIHMEGPFINHVRRGVHPPQHILPPGPEQFRQFWQAAAGQLRILTLAPEMPGAEAVIQEALSGGIRVAMGHTDATYEQAEAAADLGVRHVVHMFNAMRPFAHRDPGIIGAALLDKRLSTELIADGVHVQEPAIRLLVQVKGPERVLLVTDGVSPVGMPPGGRYRLGEFEVEVRDGAARNLEGVLAGSVLTLDRAIRNMREFTDVSLRNLIRMATLNQARLMKVDKTKGVIAPGADADLVLLTKELQVARVFVRGQEIRQLTTDHGQPIHG